MYWCNGSKFDWPDEGHANQSKKVGGRNSEEEFGQALFFVSPTPHYVPRETKIEPDRRLEHTRVTLFLRDQTFRLTNRWIWDGYKDIKHRKGNVLLIIAYF